MRPLFLFATMIVACSVTTGLVACSGTSTSTGDPDGGSASGSSGSSGTSGTSGTSGSSATSGSSGTSGTSGSSGSDAGAQCNAVAQLAPADVDLLNAVAAAPSATGGTVVDGTYTLTSATAHSGTGVDGTKIGSVGKNTMVISGTTVQQLQNSQSGKEKRSTATAAVNGSDLTLTGTCVYPAAAAGQTTTATYTATATTLTTYTPLGNSTIETVFTKQ